MKHYRLTLLLAIMMLVVLAVAAGWLFASQLYPQAILASIGAVVAVMTLYSTTRRPLRAISAFSASLESDSSQLQIPLSDDPVLSHTGEILNSIARTKALSAFELETRKLYYDRILRIITHEMRNSIAPVIALSDDMKARPSAYSGDSLAEAATIINDQCLSIKRFLDSYYQLTHLPQPELAEIEGSSLIKSLWSQVAPHARSRGIEASAVTINVTSGLTISADRDLLLRALANLMRNAFDAVAGVPSPHIDITATLLPDGGASINIADNGPGLPRTVADNLFQPFLTTKPGGSGIGLCLSRQIARLHGGDLRLAPSASGASFVLTLPPAQ